MAGRQYDSFFWETLDGIQKSLGLESDRMARLLEMQENEFLKLKRARKDPKFTHTMALSRALNVGFDSIVQRDFDSKAMVRQFFGENDALPEKYTRAAFSKRRNGLAILNFVEAHFGWQKRALILRRFQMNESMFKDPDAPISGEFGYDVLSLLQNQYQNGDLITQIGQSSVASHRHTVVGKLISQARTSAEVYDITMNEVTAKYFSKNEAWEIRKLTSDQCTVVSVPNYVRLLDKKANLDHFVNSMSCRLHLGYLRTFPIYAGLSAAEVSKLSCVCLGDLECRYEIRFRPPSFQMGSVLPARQKLN